MGTTTRFGLPYPELTDAPNGPVGVQGLASATEGWLARAVPCVSTGHPTSPPQGMIIFETDTGLWLGWDGDSWNPLLDSGATPNTAEAQFSANALQSVPTNTDRVVAFTTGQVTNAHIAQATKSTGHKFTIDLAGRWTVSTTVRYPDDTHSGLRRISLFTEAAPADAVAQQGHHGGDSEDTLSLSVTRRFSAGTAFFVMTRQESGGSRQIDPGLGIGQNGCYCRINLVYVGP